MKTTIVRLILTILLIGAGWYRGEYGVIASVIFLGIMGSIELTLLKLRNTDKLVDAIITILRLQQKV